MISPVRQTALHPVLLTVEVEERTLHSLPLDPAHFERHLLAAAREFLARPGKAFRARLVEVAYALAGGARNRLPHACLEAIELLHAGSLIVDDIQDSALTRRGAPALHQLVGTPKALNTGNWLYFVALSRLHQLDLPALRALSLSRAAHECLVRCHEGQALDLGVRVSEAKASELGALAHATSTLKTGALMGFAARLGAEVAGGGEAELLALERFGAKIGLALQMLDDLGSFVSSERSEKALEDLAEERVSWVWAWARETLDEVSFRQLLRSLPNKAEHPELCARLAQASAALGKARVRLAIAGALNELCQEFASGPALDQLKLELSRLEKSYG
jgi:geranylgeranyl pyrophosphate synthase